jgi:hypothetical protein
MLRKLLLELGFISNSVKFCKNFGENYAWYKQQFHDSRFATFTKTMTFINDVMTAKNSQELSNVITSYASPAQSCRIK